MDSISAKSNTSRRFEKIAITIKSQYLHESAVKLLSITINSTSFGDAYTSFGHIGVDVIVPRSMVRLKYFA